MIFALAAIYAAYASVPGVQTLFVGVKAAVLAIVIEALMKVSGRAFKTPLHWALACASFIALFVLAMPFPAVLGAAALTGYLSAYGQCPQTHVPVPRASVLATAALWLALWWVPVAALGLWAGADILFQIAVFFSKLASVTFGGAYAVLAFMGQQVVQDFGWLEPGEMIDALGLAETTPGPLILVTQFTGFLAGFNTGGWGLAFAAAAVTLWVTFVPCFLWIFVGAPYIAWLGAQPRLSAALDAITAAVVGVIANLSIWFAMNVLFADVTRGDWGWWPEITSVQPVAGALSVIAAVLLLGLKWSVLRVLACTSVLALALEHAF